MAKRWLESLVRKLVGRGLSRKYVGAITATSNKPVKRPDGSCFYTAAEVSENDVVVAHSSRTYPSRSTRRPLQLLHQDEVSDGRSLGTNARRPIVEPFTPTRRFADEESAAREVDSGVSPSELAEVINQKPASELPRVPIDLSCSLPEDEHVKGPEIWNVGTPMRYPLVAAPPMTGVGRYRRSKAATREWVENNIREQLGPIAPYVKTPDEEIACPWVWKEEPRSKLGSKPALSVDPDTGANVVRGFSTISVIEGPRYHVPETWAPEPNWFSAASPPADLPPPNAPRRLVNPTVLSYAEDDCAVESYDPSFPEFPQRSANAAGKQPETRAVSSFGPEVEATQDPSAPSSHGDYDDSVPEEYLVEDESRVTDEGEKPSENKENRDSEDSARANAQENMVFSPESSSWADTDGSSVSGSQSIPTWQREGEELRGRCWQMGANGEIYWEPLDPRLYARGPSPSVDEEEDAEPVYRGDGNRALPTGAELRFIDRVWNRYYPIQEREEALRAQGVDVEAEEEKKVKPPIFANASTGKFDELERWKARRPVPELLEPVGLRDESYGRTSLACMMTSKKPW
ncbi:hypothetical protein FQN54_001377 [Arachnomyces sp. PD_36]|nr:hypothetical protein FQN54_001377 [Arachnomyces sp. PD_36]